MKIPWWLPASMTFGPFMLATLPFILGKGWLAMVFSFVGAFALCMTNSWFFKQLKSK